MSCEEQSLRILSREEHNLTGTIKDDKSVISAGVMEQDCEEDPHYNMATAEIEIECSELSQPFCFGSVVKPAEDDTDESYFSHISNFSESVSV